jgi:hypothetical protein
MELEHITETIEGYEVKNLRYKAVDNILVGLVKDKDYGKESNNYFVSCVWTRQGKPIKLNKGRTELILKIV